MYSKFSSKFFQVNPPRSVLNRVLRCLICLRINFQVERTLTSKVNEKVLWSTLRQSRKVAIFRLISGFTVYITLLHMGILRLGNHHWSYSYYLPISHSSISKYCVYVVCDFQVPSECICIYIQLSSRISNSPNSNIRLIVSTVDPV